MSVMQEAKKGLRWTSLSSVSKTSLQALRVAILARFLSPVDFGLMGMALVVISFAEAYVDLGITGAIICRQDVTKEELSSLYWLNIFTGAAFAVLVWCSAPLVVAYFRQPELLPLLRAIAFVFVFSSMGKQFSTLLEKELSFNILAKLEIMASALELILSVALAAMGYRVWSLAVAFLASSSLRTIFLLHVGMARFRPSLHFKTSDLKGFVSFGMFQIGERTVNLFSERLDQILIGRFMGAEALGFYTFAFNLVSRPITRINPIVTRVAFPLFARMQNDTARLRDSYLKVIRLLTTINAPLLIGFATVAPLAVPLLFGAKWTPSVILFQLLGIVSLSRSTGNPVGSLQLAKGRADLGFYWNIFLLVMSVPTIFLGVKVAGAVGVAASLLALQLFLQVPCYLFFMRPLIGPCAKQFVGSIMTPVSGAALMSLIILAASTGLRGLPSMGLLIVETAAGALIYACYTWFIDRETFSQLQSMVIPSRSKRAATQTGLNLEREVET